MDKFNLKTPLGRFRLIAILEGISYLLFAITMPLKYWKGIPEPNYVVGMVHGLLFMVYIALCLQCILIHKWGFKTSVLSLAASVIPFGTFYANNKIFKPYSRLK